MHFVGQLYPHKKLLKFSNRLSDTRSFKNLIHIFEMEVLLGGEGFEVTTYRIDGTYEDGRHPTEVTFTANLKEDLRRRDFTINAMAYNDRSGLVDLYGFHAEHRMQNMFSHVITVVFMSLGRLHTEIKLRQNLCRNTKLVSIPQIIGMRGCHQFYKLCLNPLRRNFL